MCTHQQRQLFAQTHTAPESCEQLEQEMNQASTHTAMILIAGIVALAPILGFAIGGPVFGLIWTAFSFVYLCFIGIPFMVAATHDAREDARKAHLS